MGTQSGRWAAVAAVGLAVQSVSVRAVNVTWANSAGNTDWTAGASWTGGSAPGTNDVASFPGITIPPGSINAQPTLNAATNINALLLVQWAATNNWILSGSGTLTLGGTPGTPAGHGFEIQSYNPRVYPNIVLGGPQSWAFTVTSGGPDT